MAHLGHLVLRDWVSLREITGDQLAVSWQGFTDNALIVRYEICIGSTRARRRIALRRRWTQAHLYHYRASRCSIGGSTLRRYLHMMLLATMLSRPRLLFALSQPLQRPRRSVSLASCRRSQRLGMTARFDTWPTAMQPLSRGLLSKEQAAAKCAIRGLFAL